MDFLERDRQALAGRLVAAEVPHVKKDVGDGLFAADEAERLGWIPAHHGSLFSHDVDMGRWTEMVACQLFPNGAKCAKQEIFHVGHRFCIFLCQVARRAGSAGA
ncbi:hypothetical protein FQZ97_1055420 [compost metagenome]